MAKAAVNPFAAAKTTTPTSLTKGKPIYVAGNLVDLDGSVIHDRDEVVAAIENFAKGSKLEEQGKAMKEQNRSVVNAAAAYHFTRDWVAKRSRPENPKLVTNDAGDGVFCTVSFVDSAKKLDDAQYQHLVAAIGEAAAEENVIRRHDFTINPDALDKTVDVVKNGKTIKQNVMEAMTEALQEKFAASPEVLATLFTAVEKFETKKGLIDKALDLTGATGKSPADAVKVEAFLNAARITMSVKPGGTKTE